HRGAERELRVGRQPVEPADDRDDPGPRGGTRLGGRRGPGAPARGIRGGRCTAGAWLSEENPDRSARLRARGSGVTRTILVIEDGTEYTEAFRNLAASDAATSIELVRAADFEEARRALAERKIDAVFLDVVFDRIAPEKLAGDWEGPIRRFGGDRRRAERHLAEN